MDYSLLGSSVHRISQARILELVTVSFSRGSSKLRGGTQVSCIGRRILYHSATRETQFEFFKSHHLLSFHTRFVLTGPVCMCAHSLRRVRLFFDPMDCSLPGSPVHGISQARKQESVVISFFRGSSRPRDQTCIFCTGRQILHH